MEKRSCFGIPSIFSFTSDACRGCSDFSGCQRDSHAALKGAPLRIVRALIAEHEAFEGHQAIETPDAAVLDTTQSIPSEARVTKRKAAQRYPLTAEQKSTLSALPKTVAAFIEKLYVRHAHEEIINAAKEGRNGFSHDKHRPYYLALNMLLQSGFVRPVLRSAYQTELGWNDASAKTQVSLTWQVLIALGLAKEEGIALVASDSVKARSRNIRYQ